VFLYFFCFENCIFGKPILLPPKSQDSALPKAPSQLASSSCIAPDFAQKQSFSCKAMEESTERLIPSNN
jgi:hypothetical protein